MPPIWAWTLQPQRDWNWHRIQEHIRPATWVLTKCLKLALPSWCSLPVEHIRLKLFYLIIEDLNHLIPSISERLCYALESGPQSSALFLCHKEIAHRKGEASLCRVQHAVADRRPWNSFLSELSSISKVISFHSLITGSQIPISLFTLNDTLKLMGLYSEWIGLLV